MTDYRESSYSRSPSTDRSRTKTYTQDSDSYYSDDFEGDSRKTTPRNKARTKRSRRSPYKSDHTITSAQTTLSKKSTQSLGRRQSRNKRKNTRTQGPRSHSYSKDHASKKTQHSVLRDSVASRMLSAKRHRINELTNELAETKQKLYDTVKENRLLRTLQHRQDKAIRKFEDTESDLPRLIAQHSNEERVLRARLKKIKDSERALDHQLREKDDDIAKMERQLRNLKKLVYEKNLGERSELSRQLGDTENRLSAMERKKQELEKKLELTISSYNRQVHSEQIKHKETKMQLQSLHDEYARLEHRLKEKERALEISNIYSLRQKVSPEKALALSKTNLDSSRSTTSYLHSSATQTDLALFPLPVENGLPSPNSTPHKQITPNHRSISTPHGNVEQQHINNTNEEDKISSTFNGMKLNNGPKPHHQSTPNEGNLKSESKRSVFLTANFDSPASSRDNSFASASSKSPDLKKPVVEITDKIDSEQAALNAMLAQANKEEEYERQRKLEEEQRQKRELLARMREVENKDPSTDLNLNPVHKPPIQHATQPHKPNIVEQLFKTDQKSSTNNHNNKQNEIAQPAPKLISQSQESLKDSPLRNRKSYQFTKEVENLHRGLPASREGSAGSKPEREISFGSYAPTMGGAPARRKTQTTKPVVLSSESDADEPMFDLNSGKQKKKSDLLTQLFGEQANQPSPTNHDDGNKNVITNTKNQTPRAKPIHSNYPWERKIHTQGNGDGNLNMTSAPVVKAVPSFNDEDIEEVAL